MKKEAFDKQIVQNYRCLFFLIKAVVNVKSKSTPNRPIFFFNKHYWVRTSQDFSVERDNAPAGLESVRVRHYTRLENRCFNPL